MSQKPVTQPSRIRRLGMTCLSGVVVASGLVAFPSTAEAAPHRITFPIAADHVHKVRWSDTWGAPRSGGRSHIGVDLLGPKMVPLVAARDATITWGRFNNSRGSIVRMRDSEGWEYQYIHLNNDTPGTDNGRATCQQAFSARLCGAISNGKFKKGVKVKEGEVIGYLGDSGNAERTAAHLHFEVYQPNGKATNPAPIVDAAYNTLKAKKAAAPKPKPVTRIAATKPVGHWTNASYAVDDTFLTFHGRKPTTIEANTFIRNAESKGVWSTISSGYSDSSGGSDLTRTYAALLNRKPDLGGYRSWMRARGQGKDTRRIVAEFTRSTEFRNIFRNTSNDEYIEALYRNALGRPSDPKGKALWLRKISSGQSSRADIAYEFVRAQESKNRHRPTVEVTTMSILRFNKIPSDSEIATWTDSRSRRDRDYMVSAWYGA